MKATPQQIIQVCSKLVGISYQELDCWGVVREFYNMCFSVELKQYYELPPEDIYLARNMIQANRGDFISVDIEDIQVGDIITIFLLGVESHIAVYIGDGKILHTHRRSGCVVDRLKIWKKAVCSVFRLETT